MRLFQATILTLLTSATAVLGAPECDFSDPAPISDAKALAKKLKDYDTDEEPAYEQNSNDTGENLGSALNFSGSAQARGIYKGSDEGGHGQTSSYARDVAAAVYAIIDNCVSEDGQSTGGTEYAGGNGDFQVWLTKFHEPTTV